MTQIGAYFPALADEAQMMGTRIDFHWTLLQTSFPTAYGPWQKLFISSM
jgi:hypothetical protein